MVYYFTTRCGNYTIYMGKDKYENEDLIKYGLPEDCWFHVDDLSSAHGELTVDLWWKFIIWKYPVLTPRSSLSLSLFALEARDDIGEPWYLILALTVMKISLLNIHYLC